MPDAFPTIDDDAFPTEPQPGDRIEVDYEDYANLVNERDRLKDDLEAAAGELKVPVPEPGTDMAKLLSANVLLKRRLRMAKESGDPHIRSDWERAHELLDQHGVLTTPPKEMGVHLITRLKAALEVWDAVGILSGNRAYDLKYVCDDAEIKAAIVAHRDACRPAQG